MNKKITAIVGSASALLAVLIYYSILPFGRTLNIFLKCKQVPENSFPCYGVYDIYMILLLGVVVIGCLVALTLKFKKSI